MSIKLRNHLRNPKVQMKERSDDLYQTIVTEARKKGISVSELERKSGMAKGAVYKMKTSSPTLNTLDRVAEVLGIETSTLVARSKKK